MDHEVAGIIRDIGQRLGLARRRPPLALPIRAPQPHHGEQRRDDRERLEEAGQRTRRVGLPRQVVD
jgi:hypothetical protein